MGVGVSVSSHVRLLSVTKIPSEVKTLCGIEILRYQ